MSYFEERLKILIKKCYAFYKLFIRLKGSFFKKLPLVMPLLFVKLGIKSVKVLRIKVILNDTQRLTEALEMNKLSLAKELYRLSYVGVVGKTQDVIVGLARLLLCCELIRRTRCEKPP